MFRFLSHCVTGMLCALCGETCRQRNTEIIVCVIGFSGPDLIRAARLIRTILYYRA